MGTSKTKTRRSTDASTEQTSRKTNASRPKAGGAPRASKKTRGAASSAGTGAKSRRATGSSRGRAGHPRDEAARAPGRTAAPARAARRQRDAAPYHHGDLRRALLAATEELLESGGVDAFTLREVARRAGVSHGAPAHHFGDVQGLLSEFTAESFAQLAAAMRRRRAEAPEGAFAQLRASGIAYVEYAVTHRARFQLMFRSDRLDWNRASLAMSSADAFGQFVECMNRVCREAGAPPELDADKIALAWSTVHGFATLLIDNRMFTEIVSGGELARALDALGRVLDSMRPALERQG